MENIHKNMTQNDLERFWFKSFPIRKKTYMQANCIYIFSYGFKSAFLIGVTTEAKTVFKSQFRTDFLFI